jgi:hypothetical protein
VDRVSEETVTYKLLSNPTDPASSKYSFTMAILQGTEDSRAAIRFVNDIRRVFNGLGMGRNDGQDILNRRELVARMLRGTCLAAFNQAFDHALRAFRNTPVNPRNVAGGETEAQYNARVAARQTHPPMMATLAAGIHAIITDLTPNKALQTQKRWMRRHLRKTREMNVRSFAAHLLRINDEELPALPPNFDDTQKLQPDEMVDILINAVPKKWSAEMDRLDFDPWVAGWNDTVEFLVRMEQAAEHEGNDSTVKVDGNSNKSAKKPKTSSGNNNKGSGNSKTTGLKYCHFHGHNDSHDSNACRTLKKMAESTKEGKSQSKNKTWTRKDSNKTGSKDLATFIQKTIRKEMNAFSKKRKSDTLEEGELDNIDFAGLNFQDMDNLRIDSDDDSIDV